MGGADGKRWPWELIVVRREKNILQIPMNDVMFMQILHARQNRPRSPTNPKGSARCP